LNPIFFEVDAISDVMMALDDVVSSFDVKED
jgi:hypothetical protein